MSFKFDLRKFKKVHADKNTTTLVHDDGHKIQIAHEKLSPKIKSQLSELKFADGGEVKDDVPELNKKNAEEFSKGAKKSGWMPESWQKNIEEGIKPEPSSTPKAKKPQAFAEGGTPSSDNSDGQAPVVVNVNGQPQIPDMLSNPNPGSQAAAQNPPINQNAMPDAGQLPYGVSPEQAQQMNQLAQNMQQSESQLPPGQSSQIAPPVDPMHTLVAPPKAQMPEPPAQKAAGIPPSPAPPPDSMHGYQSQMQGLNEMMAGESAMGNAQANALSKAVQNQQMAMKHYDDQFKTLNDERMAFQKDIASNLIDPNRYMANRSTGDAIKQGIGLILGGFGTANGQENLAMKVLNDKIHQDIEAQRTNLGARENLLSANLKQFGNLRDATDMTRVMTADIVTNQLKQAAAAAQSPLAKARALQAAGQLEQQFAPVYQQLVMRQALQNNGGKVEDPSAFVPYLVPQPHQKDVFKEISNAQGAVKNHEEILKQFDKAAQENTVLRTGAGLLRQPASVANLHALFLPMIHDAEGRVSEYEGKTLTDLIPAPGDTSNKIAEKRQGLESFINIKKHAPTAKAYGIDLEKFPTTSSSPETRLNPQQQQYLDFARKNPQDPRSQMILKKLGIHE